MPTRNWQKLTPMSAFARENWFLFPLVLALALFSGCGRKPDRESAKPADLPAGMVESIVQKHWMGQEVKVKNITYDAPFPSKGGHVPPGVKLFPAKVRVSIGSGPEKDFVFYF